MKKLLALLCFLLSLASCSNAQNKQTQTAQTNDVLKVLYFHGKQRCVTCRAIEKLTKEVLDSDFSEQMKSGKIEFKIIDFSTKEGEKTADSYEVAWSSLILDKKGDSNNLTDMAFSYAKNQPEVFKTKLKEEIDKSLK